MNRLEELTPSAWAGLLSRACQMVSEAPACKTILRDIGHIRFQLDITDRPELSYWEEYLGDHVVPHLGRCEDCTVQVSTTYSVLLATLMNRLSIMEAAAEEAYELRGDTQALMKCANILPYMMLAFVRVVEAQFPELAEAPA